MKRASFSLIEVLVLITIMGLMAAIAVPAYTKYLEGAKVKKARQETKILAQTAKTYFLDVGDYPNALEDLVQRPSSSKTWHGPYLEYELPKDPWDQPYNYDKPGADHRAFDIYSFGADGQPGGEGYAEDIGHWIR
jgi:general secretion pathway protein G